MVSRGDAKGYVERQGRQPKRCCDERVDKSVQTNIHRGNVKLEQTAARKQAAVKFSELFFCDGSPQPITVEASHSSARVDIIAPFQSCPQL